MDIGIAIKGPQTLETWIKEQEKNNVFTRVSVNGADSLCTRKYRTTCAVIKLTQANGHR